MTARRSRESKTQTPSPALPRFQAPGPLTLEQRLGHIFAHPELLTLALTHRSFAYEARAGSAEKPATEPASATAREKTQRNQPGSDNEQLEFLGDAILGFCVAEALYREFPQCTEGELTRMRAALVSRQRMAQMGAALGLGDELLLGRSAEQNGGRTKPALLANAAEAIIAAMYLDAGSGGLEAVCRIVEQHLLAPERDALRAALARDAGHGALRDHKTLLQERVQAAGNGRLRYVDLSQSGPAHQRTFTVQALMETDGATRLLATAEGSSKKEAQQRAAELALATWEDSAAPAPSSPQPPSTARTPRPRKPRPPQPRKAQPAPPPKGGA